MSSHQISFGSEDMIFRATPGSPISIAIPSGKQPPLILDMGSILPYSARPFEQYPPAILRAVMQSLGGILAGIYSVRNPSLIRNRTKEPSLSSLMLITLCQYLTHE